MSIKRYEVNGSSSVFEDESGSLVDYQDYADLEAKCAALAAENAGLKNFIVSDCHVAHIEPETFYEEEVTRYVSADGYEPETPATDAFLAEVRAQGVELYLDENPSLLGLGSIATLRNYFLPQIRSGEVSWQAYQERKDAERQEAAQ